MSTKELRKKLIDRINEEGNNDLLERALDFFEKPEPESIYVLNKGQIAAIAEAKQQIANGNCLSNQESKAEIEEWLNRK